MSTARRRSRLAALAGLAAWAALVALRATALASGPEPEPEPPDTTLHQFLGTMSDSTDAYFGKSAAPLDTTGLDSAATYSSEVRGRVRFGPLPSFDFSRADGSTFGGVLRIDGPGRAGRLTLHAAYAVGAQQWLGGAEVHRQQNMGGAYWTIDGWGGRETAPMNRDYAEPYIDPLRALATGSDRTNYVRHDGWRASLERENNRWRAVVGVRDVLESPLETTATWDMLHRDLIVTPNLPAAFGRVHEVHLGAGTRLPVVPFRIEADYWASGPALKSDFAYDRVRLALGGDVTVGRWGSVVPQAVWGMLNGEATAQESFYLGAGPTRVSIPRDALAGSSFGIAKLQIIGAGDLLGMLRLPHPALLYLQPGVFATTAAVGGVDPRGGPARTDTRWPERSSWLSEAGVSLHYNPGVLGATLRFSEAWPLGPTTRGERFEFAIVHPMDLLHRPLEE